HDVAHGVDVVGDPLGGLAGELLLARRAGGTRLAADVAALHDEDCHGCKRTRGNPVGSRWGQLPGDLPQLPRVTPRVPDVLDVEVPGDTEPTRGVRRVDPHPVTDPPADRLGAIGGRA